MSLQKQYFNLYKNLKSAIRGIAYLPQIAKTKLTINVIYAYHVINDDN